MLVFLVGLLFSARQALTYYSLGQPTGFVNDYAGVLSSGEEEELENQLNRFEEKTSNEIVVVILPNLGEDTIENFAVKLFEDWGIGKKEKDNGVLLLVAMEEKRVRIEVGYGLEGVLTDAQSYWIVDRAVKPAFRKGEYYEGINEAVKEIMAASGGEAPFFQNSVSSEESPLFLIFLFGGMVFIWLGGILTRTKSWWLGGVIGAFWGLVITFISGFLYYGLFSLIFFTLFGLFFDRLLSRAYEDGKRRGHVPWWTGGGGFGGGSGGFGGGFGGFGGGSSGGGGASGSW